MNFFRLVLCMAGLAIYLLARHAVNNPPHVAPQNPAVHTNTDSHAAVLAASSELAGVQKHK